MQKINFSQTKLAYLAGLLDGDGSIYARIKKRKDCKYNLHISPCVVFFQSLKARNNFVLIFKEFNFGYHRQRKDGMLEYIINKQEDIYNFLTILKPFIILKNQQLKIMLEIIEIKRLPNTKKNFDYNLSLAKKLKKLNYSNT